MGGKWYVLVIVDDYSRYSWVFFWESKDEVFEHFWSLALRLNNEHPNCLKASHSDNGTEFKNGAFDEFCLEHGIDQRFLSLVSHVFLLASIHVSAAVPNPISRVDSFSIAMRSWLS
jgi:hypothetical protein